MNDPKHGVPKESAPLNYDRRMQTVPYGCFELCLVEKRDSGQNLFPVIKQPKLERLKWEKKLKKGKSYAFFSSILIGNNFPRWEKDDFPHFSGIPTVRENIWKIIILLIK